MSKVENNLTAKIFALIIAIILWSYVMSVENPYMTKNIRNINVNLYNTSSLDRRDIAIMEPEGVKISVEVGGKKSVVDKITSSNIVAEIDLSGYDEGQIRVPVNVSLLNNPDGIEIVNWEPKEVLFTLDKIIPKEKMVRVEVEGELGEDYVLGDIVSRPETVLIRGPRSWVNEVADVKATVDISGETKSFNIARPIQITDDQGNEVRGLEKEPSVVELDIPILRKYTLPIELQTEGQLPEGFIISEIKINPSRIAVKGDDRILNLTHINTKTIDINSLLDSSSMEVELDLPDGVQLLNPNEKVTIDYVMEEVTAEEFTFDFDEIDIRNLDGNLSIENGHINTKIQVFIESTESELEDMTKDDLKLYIDLEDLGEGSHEVDINIEGISGIKIEAIIPERIELKLSPKIGE